MLKPDGRLGLSDLTRTEEAVPELEGLLSWIACVGDALPTNRYTEILQAVGFHIGKIENHNDALIAMVHQIQSKASWCRNHGQS